MNKNPEFEKIPTDLKIFQTDTKISQEINKLKWCVTEKIHGANFSFIYENNRLFFAKRKEYLEWNDDFFGFQNVVIEIETQIIALFEALNQNIEAKKYIIYGELFGGKYPHESVKPIPNIEAIQTGVYYNPNIKFCAFDIALEIEEEGKIYKKYLDYSQSIDYFKKFDLFYAKILAEGKLNEVMNFDIRINSTIPAQFGLPQLNSNLIEGIIIKPLQHNTLKNTNIRPIIKIKNKEFDEEGKFHEAEKWSFIPKVVAKSEELSFLIEEIKPFINHHRIQSAISKIGQLNQNQARIEAIKDEILTDVWFDFNLKNNQILDSLDFSQEIWIKDRIKALIAFFLKG